VGVTRDRDLAEDLVQVTFTRVLEQGGTVDPMALRAWLYRVALNEALAFRRREQVRERADRAGLTARPDGERLPGDDLVERERAERVRRAVNALPPAMRSVVEARIDEGRTFAQIAEREKLPLGTVLSRMQRALERLRRALEGEMTP
jgi:RNA polymerase sigma-70 factor (ECF subfamily)